VVATWRLDQAPPAAAANQIQGKGCRERAPPQSGGGPRLTIAQPAATHLVSQGRPDLAKHQQATAEELPIKL